MFKKKKDTYIVRRSLHRGRWRTCVGIRPLRVLVVGISTLGVTTRGHTRTKSKYFKVVKMVEYVWVSNLSLLSKADGYNLSSFSKTPCLLVCKTELKIRKYWIWINLMLNRGITNLHIFTAFQIFQFLRVFSYSNCK